MAPQDLQPAAFLLPESIRRIHQLPALSANRHSASSSTETMAKFERHIFVCTNQRQADAPRGCCDPNGLGELQLAFKKELAARGLKDRMRANKAGCLDQCEHGPTIVVYPEGIWYGHVKTTDVAEIVESHLVHGQPVERLRLTDDDPPM